MQDGDYLKIMGAIFAVLFLLAAPGLTFWPVAMVFLIFAYLALAMIVKAPLPWPVRAVFLAILASALLLQARRGRSRLGAVTRKPNRSPPALFRASEPR